MTHLLHRALVRLACVVYPDPTHDVTTTRIGRLATATRRRSA